MKSLKTSKNDPYRLKIEKEVRQYFDAPQPKRKAEFLSSLPKPRTSHTKFIINQIRYIDLSFWIATLFCILIEVAIIVMSQSSLEKTLFAFQLSKENVWLIFSLLPLFTMLSSVELFKSYINNTDEIEKSCFYNLEQIFLARIIIIGVFNILILGLLVFTLKIIDPIRYLEMMVYLLIPYLISGNLNLLILKHIRGKEGRFISITISLFVGLLSFFLKTDYPQIYSSEYSVQWMSLLISVLLLLGIQIYHLIHKRRTVHAA